jgi:hypothetical protein
LLDKLIHQSANIPPAFIVDAEVAITKSKSVTSARTTNTIAARLAAKSGADLFTAAAAKLHFVDGKESFSRKDLLAEVRQAKQYFNENYISNASSILKGLVKTTLNEVSKDTFALSAKAVTNLEPKLAS